MPSVLQVLFLTHFLTYWGIVGVAWAIEAYRMSRERELRASQLEAQLADARLEALKMQLHPHFLFNSLNSILPLVFRDRDAAARTVVQLGELLRISLEREATAHILLSQELEFLKLYLELQKTRYQDRLTVSVAVEPNILAAEVPNLILQPLVENAIKHGVGALPGSGHIEVRGFREGGFLILCVSDDGPGIPEGEDPEKSGGVGLRNTRARLEHLYERRHRFEHANRPEGGLAVTLAIPLSFSRPSDAGEPGSRPRADARGPAGSDST
jgi:sensor histidine kinase YesM